MRFDGVRSWQWAEGLAVGCGGDSDDRVAAILVSALGDLGLRVERSNAGSDNASNLAQMVWATPDRTDRPPCRFVFFTTLDLTSNRDGLALLYGLARSWPRDGREGPAFAAVSPSRLNRVLNALDTVHPASAADPPRLVIGWRVPAMGAGLTLRERGTGGLAARAAADLWVPHRLRRPPGFWRFRHAPAAVFVEGDGDFDACRAGPIDLAALNRAAMLVSEIAMRWVRLP